MVGQRLVVLRCAGEVADGGRVAEEDRADQAVPSATRANSPSWWTFSLVNPPPTTPTAPAPRSARTAARSAATRSGATGQLVAGSSPRSRTNGVVSRAPGASSPAGLRPLPHNAPRLTGKSARSRTSGGVPALSRMPHRNARYGQRVAVVAGAAVETVSVMTRP